MTLEEKLESLRCLKNSDGRQQITPEISGDSTRDMTDNCPICNGLGWVLDINDEGQIEAKSCKCREEEIMRRRTSFAEIPPAYGDSYLNNFSLSVYKDPESKSIAKAACDKVKKYLEWFEGCKQEGLGLYFYSKTKGSGKTRMAASLAHKFLYTYIVKFATSSQILNEIKRTYDRNNDQSESDLLDALVTADVLFIDDFGSEKPSGWVNDKFYHIVNERYVNKKLTFFTSNSSIEELDYDDRIKSRVQGMTYQIPFPEESVRQNQARERNKALGASKIP